MFVSVYRVIKFALQDFFRNFWLSFITITIIVLTFISINLLLVLNVLAQAAADSVREKIDVSFYLKPKVSQDEVEDLRLYLLSLKETKEVRFISAEEALQEFQARHQDDPEILTSLEEIGENPLVATLVVKAKDLKDYSALLESLDKSTHNNLILEKNFEDHQEVITRIDYITKKVRQVGIAVSLIFTLITVLIVANTIRVAIYTHREEIGIMRLVGANNWFIRVPFLLEGVFLGLVAGAVSITIWFALLSLIQPNLASFFAEIDFNILTYFSQNLVRIFGLELLGVVILNILSSAMAVGRYLRV